MWQLKSVDVSGGGALLQKRSAERLCVSAEMLMDCLKCCACLQRQSLSMALIPSAQRCSILVYKSEFLVAPAPSCGGRARVGSDRRRVRSRSGRGLVEGAARLHRQTALAMAARRRAASGIYSMKLFEVA